VRKHQLEGIFAKRSSSQYRSSECPLQSTARTCKSASLRQESVMPERRVIWLITLSVLMASNTSFAQTTRNISMGGEVVSDFKYLTNNALLDAEDIATSPIYAASPDSPLRAPKFYLVLAGAGALWVDRTLSTKLCAAI
jgi:hypothetical protein